MAKIALCLDHRGRRRTASSCHRHRQALCPLRGSRCEREARSPAGVGRRTTADHRRARA
jgi:hypothetical protein